MRVVRLRPLTGRRWVLVLAGLAALAPVGTAPRASAATPVTLAARIDGRAVAEATERRPIRLHPDRPAVLELRVVNTSTLPIDLRTVRLAGDVMGLTFFAYDTTISLPLAPGEDETRSYAIDLVGLKHQAVGLIQGSVDVLDARRDTVGSQRMVVDVRGSLWSVYGAFGIAVAVLTVISLGGALIALSRQRLPDERWRRALRFLTPGLGIGLFIVFTLSALRIFVPRPGRSLMIVLVCGAVMFGLGYLTPGPDEEDEEEEGIDAAGARREQTADG